MKEVRSLGLIIAAIFGLLALGAFFSPTYTEQMSYAQWFLFAGGVLFIVAVVILVAAVGFHTFALYLAVLMAMAIAAFGLYGGFLVLILTYATWGLVFAMQLLLIHHRVPSAIDWFRDRYTYRTFHAEYRLFYPMIWLFYFLLEILPYLLFRDRLIPFAPKKILHFMKTILPET